ncbi:MAG: preprotein translocase subunit SecE [Mycobacterium sp.]|nr:preprotein translocase subunit SecE [Mycobacterium sp.]
MSDEPDGAAGEDADQTGALTQPLRPTGKRPRQRPGASTALAEVEVTDEALTEEFEAADEGDAKGKKKKSKKDRGGKTRNPFMFVWTYLGQVVAELRKVIWPNRKQMVSYTTVVLVFLVFMVALIGVTDLGWHRLVLLVFG